MDDQIKYPVGDSSFSYIRQNRLFYIDKTLYIYRMVTEGQFYFLSRPRRFGKSLLVSTLNAYFTGRKELFDGLAISGLEKEWVSYPVLRLDLSVGNMKDHSNLLSVLNAAVGEWESLYGRNEAEDSLFVRFYGVIRRAHSQSGKRVVVLIDEYDNPLFSTLDSSEHEKMRETLKGMYSVLKAAAEDLRFCFLTGITRFSKMSVFSGLNNLEDLSFQRDYAAICGITHEELLSHCRSGISKVASSNGWSFERAVAELKGHYDGYRFASVSPDIYNPFSLIQAFKTGELRPYWFESGRAQFLVEMIMKTADRESLLNILSPVITFSELGATEEQGLSLPALLFQTGYLTIRGVKSRGNAFHLAIPNEEVKLGLMEDLIPLASKMDRRRTVSDIERLRDFADRGDVDSMMNYLRSFLSGISYRLTHKMPEI